MAESPPWRADACSSIYKRDCAAVLLKRWSCELCELTYEWVLTFLQTRTHKHTHTHTIVHLTHNGPNGVQYALWLAWLKTVLSRHDCTINLLFFMRDVLGPSHKFQYWWSSLRLWPSMALDCSIRTLLIHLFHGSHTACQTKKKLFWALDPTQCALRL